MTDSGSRPEQRTRPNAVPTLSISSEDRSVNAETAVFVALGEHEMRRDLAHGVLRVFLIGNLAIWILILLMIAIDVLLIMTGHETPSERVVDRSVVRTLVTATAVQVGLIMVTIAGNLFPRARESWWRFWD